MTHIRISDFCAKHGYTEHQIRHATRTGKLERVTKGIVDEQHALQAMSYAKPLKAKKQTKTATDTVGQPEHLVSLNPTSERPEFLSQEWLKSKMGSVKEGGRVFPPNE